MLVPNCALIPTFESSKPCALSLWTWSEVSPRRTNWRDVPLLRTKRVQDTPTRACSCHAKVGLNGSVHLVFEPRLVRNRSDQRSQRRTSGGAGLQRRLEAR